MTAFRPAPCLETERLQLACLGPGDAPGLRDALAETRAELLPWMPWAEAEPRPVAELLAQVLDWRDAFHAGRDFHYGIFARASGRLIGVVGLHPRVGPGGLEIGYWVRHGETGRGVATEAAAAATRAAFRVLGAARVEIHVDGRNLASLRVPEKLGFRLEGRLREWFAQGEESDRVVHGLLARELAGTPADAVRMRAFGLAGEALFDDLSE
ncbi:MAG: GNAT family N-acetyltransferase [Planctomycetes bacterium]|nr:GNAT family N-acetyltransferase [Planctomycetota bacterium]